MLFTLIRKGLPVLEIQPLEMTPIAGWDILLGHFSYLFVDTDVTFKTKM